MDDGGSIPARAGEPPPSTCGKCGRWVYPRACGGTRGVDGVGVYRRGLSPRVRGNQPGYRHAALHGGSIPARAGEPPDEAGSHPPDEVYPRACGGTTAAGVDDTAVAGLSPRVRGNHAGQQDDHLDVGSIPARAGEPRAGLVAGQHDGVYPRACGGTITFLSVRGRRHGLSPRVRGNLLCGGGGYPRRRSIPARAGEPRTTPGTADSREVYPRACGGTTSAV